MYETVIVPLDGSHLAERAVDEAVTVVQRGAGRLTLVQVIPNIEQLYLTAQPNPIDTAEQTSDSLARAAYDEGRIAAREYLEKVSHSIKDCGFDVTTQIAEGDAATQILNLAQDLDAKVIVITPYGNSASSTPREAGVFGRVADEVLRKANVPVLVVKHGSGAC